jgi:hypothetical protein
MVLLLLLSLNGQLPNFDELNEDEINEITLQAKKDANRDVNEVKWLFIGCASLVIGANHARTAGIPPPNPERLLGKSGAYIETYEAAYSRQVRNRRMTYSIIGCIGGTIIYAVAITQGVNYVERTHSDVENCCGSGHSGLWGDISGCCAAPGAR